MNEFVRVLADWIIILIFFIGIIILAFKPRQVRHKITVTELKKGDPIPLKPKRR